MLDLRGGEDAFSWVSLETTGGKQNNKSCVLISTNNKVKGPISLFSAVN